MKWILIYLAVFFIASNSNAQIPGFCLGPKVGFNTKKLTSDFDSIRSDPDGSFQFGAFVRLGKKVYFQPEVNYVVKGGKIDIEGLGVQQIKLRSITVPLLVGFRPINTGVFNFRLMAGPAMSFVSEIILKPDDLSGGWPIKTKDDLKDMNWSFQFGGGVDILKFTLDLRYEIGVDNLYQGEKDFNLRNNLLNVSLGIKLL